jgi:hypothetical protein
LLLAGKLCNEGKNGDRKKNLPSQKKYSRLKYSRHINFFEYTYYSTEMKRGRGEKKRRGVREMELVLMGRWRKGEMGEREAGGG